MAKASFTNLKLKPNTTVKTIEGGIEVLQYLPIEDKKAIIDMALQNSLCNDGTYDETMLEMYKDLYMIYSYTNISFTDKQKEDEFKTYNLLKGNGMIARIMDAIPDNEKFFIEEKLYTMTRIKMEYGNTMASIVRSFINDMPANAEQAGEIIKNFDPAMFQQVVEFAKAANGGRDIK